MYLHKGDSKLLIIFEYYNYDYIEKMEYQKCHKFAVEY